MKSVAPGGWILYNGEEFPADCTQEGVHVLARPFTEIANELGNARAGNMIMLGALLEITGVLRDVNVDAALGRLVKNPRFTEMNRRALDKGRALARE